LVLLRFRQGFEIEHKLLHGLGHGFSLLQSGLCGLAGWQVTDSTFLPIAVLAML
jgi:hypothetical protein